MPGDRIDDTEVLLRRIPPGDRWFEPPDWITSANFKLRKGETGLSVYRERLVGVEEVLAKRGAIEGSIVIRATAGDIRRAMNGKNEVLNLDVVATNDETDIGHCEIRGHFSSSVAESLKRLFRRTSDDSG